MLQYLVILLDDTAVAYCHADNPLTERNLMPFDTLRKAIVYGMKENLMIQFVYPAYDLPDEYNTLIESIDHIKIGREVAVFNTIPKAIGDDNVVLRLRLGEVLARPDDIARLFPEVMRLNLVITDVETFRDEQIPAYEQVLNGWCDALFECYRRGARPQVNLLTDRLQLDLMHNCDAGNSNVTVAPNGRFYLCPAFYYDERTGVSNRLNHHKPSSDRAIGDLDSGLCVPNQQLLKLDNAPLCRICDAFHCRRCIWLNQRLTWDANTPSHQQCVMAHLERNASRRLQLRFREAGMPVDQEIKEINYLDPFDVREQK